MDISAFCASMRDKYGIEECYKKIKAAGFEAIDWDAGKMWRITITSQTGEIPKDCLLLRDFDQIKEHYKRERECIKEAGLKIAQAHAPIAVYFKNNKKFEDDVAKANINMIKLCKFMGAPYLVIHSPSKALDEPEFTFEQKRQATLDRFSCLIPAIKETGVKVLLENTFDRASHRFAGTRTLFTGGSYADVYEAIDHIDTLNEKAGCECFGFCLDTGHLTISRRRFRPYIDKLDTRLKALHLHDCNGWEDDHFVPFMGLCDWDGLIDGLRAVGYRGAINFEFDPEPYADDLYKVGRSFEKRILE